MRTKQLLKDINGVFIPPVKTYYFWKAQPFPYFYPTNYISTIFRVRKLKLRSEEYRDLYVKKYPHTKNSPESIYKKLPMVRRNKSWIIKNLYIEVGSPIKYQRVELGWKDKFNSPRFEWQPCVSLYFFGLQLAIYYNAPDGDNDRYFEQVLWYLNYCDKDINKARDTWGWTSGGVSTWNDKYVV